MTDARRALPSVATLLESDASAPLLEHAPRSVVVDAMRRTIDPARTSPSTGARGDTAAWATAIAAASRAPRRRRSGA